MGRLAPARDAEPLRLGGRGGDPIASRGGKGGAGLIRLSVPEVRKLLVKIVWDWLPPVSRTLAWFECRRRHQYRARVSNYRKRRAKPPDD